MATFLFHDRNKAAFINGVNKLFKDNSIEQEISNTDLIDTSSAKKAEFTIFITDEPQEAEILKQAEKDKYFSFPFREIDLKEIIEKSKSLQESKRGRKKSSK